MDRRRLLALTFLFEGATLALAFALGLATGILPFDLLRSSAAGIGAGALAGAAMFAALVPAMRSDWPPFSRLADTVREIAARFFARSSALDLAIVSAMAGIAEEALFRGVVQPSLTGPFGTPVAVVVAGILFGMVHFLTVTYVVVASAIGILLGVLLVVTGDLAAPIIAHALYDFLALFYLVRIRRVQEGTVADEARGDS